MKIKILLTSKTAINYGILSIPQARNANVSADPVSAQNKWSLRVKRNEIGSPRVQLASISTWGEKNTKRERECAQTAQIYHALGSNKLNAASANRASQSNYPRAAEPAKGLWQTDYLARRAAAARTELQQIRHRW